MFVSVVRSALAAALLTCFVTTTSIAGSPILHYERTNKDGSNKEHIFVYRRQADRLEVYKMMAPCTGAALVTAKLDLKRGEAVEVVGGRLARGAQQVPLATLVLDVATRVLSLNVKLPDKTIQEKVTLGPDPLWLYDFDMAEFAAIPIEHGADGTARYSVALAWPEPSETIPPFQILGLAVLKPLPAQDGIPGDAVRYSVDGPAFGEQRGEIAVDSKTGHIRDLTIGRPNHPGYDAFVLRLVGTEPGGDVAWKRRLESHFDGCPLPPQ